MKFKNVFSFDDFPLVPFSYIFALKGERKKVIIPGGRRKFHVAPHIGELSKDIKYEKI
jgi:hypothetical protein